MTNPFNVTLNKETVSMRSLFVSMLMLISAPAWAIDFTAVLKDDDGKPMCVSADKDGICIRQFTLGIAVRNALDAPANQQSLSPEEKDRRGELSQSLIGATDTKLLDSDIKTIKTAIGNAYPPSIVHKVWKLLDEKPASATSK